MRHTILASPLVTDDVPDGVQQVRLAQTDAAVQEQRIVLRRRSFGHGLTRGMRQPIAVADDKGVKHVARIQARKARRLRPIRVAIALIGRIYQFRSRASPVLSGLLCSILQILPQYCDQ